MSATIQSQAWKPLTSPFSGFPAVYFLYFRHARAGFERVIVARAGTLIFVTKLFFNILYSIQLRAFEALSVFTASFFFSTPKLFNIHHFLQLRALEALSVFAASFFHRGSEALFTLRFYPAFVQYQSLVSFSHPVTLLHTSIFIHLSSP